MKNNSKKFAILLDYLIKLIHNTHIETATTNLNKKMSNAIYKVYNANNVATIYNSIREVATALNLTYNDRKKVFRPGINKMENGVLVWTIV